VGEGKTALTKGEKQGLQKKLESNEASTSLGGWVKSKVGGNYAKDFKKH